MGRRSIAVCIVALSLCAGPLWAQSQPVNPTAASLERFEKRVADYMKLRNKAEATLPPQKTTSDAGLIRERQVALARAVQAARPVAQSGELFTPDVAAILRRLIATDFAHRTLQQRRAALKEVPAVHLKPNDEYPTDQPLATVPPRLLAQLPRLPDGLEFRLVGDALIVRDRNTNLVVDVLDDALPRR